MRFVIASVAAVLSLSFAPVPVREFRIDAGHSDIAFKIGFLGHAVRGRFDDIRGTIAYVADNPAASAITVVIGAKSIATGSAHRDEHLRSSDFFDVAKYPSIVFRSAAIAKRGDALIVTGPLTMHGITRTITIPFRETTPAVADPHGSTLIFFSGHVRLARNDFGILGGSKFNDWFDDLRSATMADSVDITLDVAGWDIDVERTSRYDAPLKRLQQEGVAPMLTRLRARLAHHRDSLRSSRYDIEQLARGIQQRGDPTGAISLLRLLVEAFETDASAHATLARAYEISGDLTSARTHTSRALALDSLETRALELGRRLGIKSVATAP